MILSDKLSLGIFCKMFILFVFEVITSFLQKRNNGNLSRGSLGGYTYGSSPGAPRPL